MKIFHAQRLKISIHLYTLHTIDIVLNLPDPRYLLKLSTANEKDILN